jgi:plasmid stabilization system protein ParE
MAAYRFYATADAAQDKIWHETVETWGEAQAISYITGLHAHILRLTKNKALWRRLPRNLAVAPDVKKDAYFTHYERHYLFFRELENGDIGVISILHDRMDLPVRLAEDLAILDRKACQDSD